MSDRNRYAATHATRLALLLGLAGWAGHLMADAPATVMVDLAAQHQVIRGWGTSLCWWANVIGGWSDHRRNEIADLLFDPTRGLGLNVVRYNIGGGDAPGHHHHRAGGDIPGFRPTPYGPYDWPADANQRWMLLAAIARGADVTEAFCNSPPWWMTYSGCSSGHADGRRNNLRDECYDDFADYLAEVVQHYRDAWGISFDTIDPLNEPGGYWWKAEKGQEGCHFDKPAQSRIISALAEALRRRELSTEISAMDSHSIDWAIGHFSAYGAAAQEAVRQLNVHAYKGSHRAEVRNFASARDMRLWMSEVDHAARVGEHGHDHDNMLPALRLAEAIVDDLRDLQPEAWVFWQAVENEQYCVWWKFNYGLLHGDFMHGTETFHLTRKYYAMGQFTRFVRPGSRMVGIDAEDAVAFLQTSAHSLVIVSVNSSEQPRRRAYAIDAEMPARALVYRTDDQHNLARMPELAISAGLFVSDEPARSITTYLVPGVTPGGPIRLNDTAQRHGADHFHFVGEWSFKGGEPGAFTRDNHWSSRIGDYYEVHFRGRRIELFGARDPTGGIAAISLDGEPEMRVDCYSPRRQDQWRMYASPALPLGDHVLTVRVTGDKNPDATHAVISADRADILP